MSQPPPPPTTTAQACAQLVMASTQPASLASELKKLKLQAPVAEEACKLVGVEDPETCRKNTAGLAHLVAALPMDTLPQMQLAVAFITNSDQDTLREYCAERLDVISRQLTNRVCDNELLSFKTVRFVLTALLKRGDPHLLSTIHTDFMQLCISAKLYTLAKSVAELEIRALAPRKDHLFKSETIAADAIRYYYYCGIVFAGLHDYKQACQCFITGLSLPARTMGAMHLAIYKKFMLTSLLYTGKLDALPNYICAPVLRGIEELKKSGGSDLIPYVAFANEFQSKTSDVLIKENHEEFTKDGNQGLVDACLAAYHRNRVARLTTFYLTLSLEKIARIANIPDVKKAEALVLGMIEKGEISAKIDQKSASVYFVSSDNSKDVEAEMAKIVEFANQLSQVDANLATNKRFVTKLMQRGGSSSPLDPSAGSAEFSR